MNQDFEKELRRAEREKEQARRVESFWDAFRLTENGHVKSTLLLNSFCLSILFLAVYGAAFFPVSYTHLDVYKRQLFQLRTFCGTFFISAIDFCLQDSICSLVKLETPI